MLVRHGRGHHGIVLAALTAAALFPLLSSAASDPRALKCVEDFVDSYSKVGSYRTTMIKREFGLGGDLLHDEKIGLEFEKPRRVVFRYLNEGITGIRNNGMTVGYTSGEEVEVKLGKPEGLGLFVNGVASLAVGGRMSLFDSKVLDDEVFTLNRAGFDYLAYALGKHLPTLRTSELGGISFAGEQNPSEPCRVRYVPHLSGEETIDLRPGESVFPVEERFATLAYVIYFRNRDKLASFRDLFVRKEPLKLKVPRAFTEFDMEIDRKTKLPLRFVMRFDGKVAGEYDFQDTESKLR